MSIFRYKYKFLLALLLLLTGFKRDLAGNQGILFPFYIYPTQENIKPLLNAKTQYPNLPLRVILNPHNGVGKTNNVDYAAAVKALRQAGISVLGYVSTKYSKRSLSDAKKEIDHWKLWYNPDGIFFDEMNDNHVYYQTLNEYAHKKGIQFTVGNPGIDLGIDSALDVDTLNIFENSSLPNLEDFQNWPAAGYAPDKISMLSYGISTYPTSFAAESGQVFGWIFITNNTLPNPWNAYPSYFQELVDHLGRP